MVAYTEPQQRKEEDSQRLRGERDQIEFIGLGFERDGRLQDSGKQEVPEFACSWDEG